MFHVKHLAIKGRGAQSAQVPTRFGLAEREVDGDWRDYVETLDGPPVKLRTTVIEQRQPNYLRSQGTGEDNSLASTLKQDSEIFLTEQPDGQTELRMKVQVQVLGRLGTFGLSAMKTKADRLWEEFARNLQSRLEPQTSAGA